MRIGYAKGKLEGDWAIFAKIAGPFVNKVLVEDREDFLHDLLIEMVKVKAKYEAREKTLTEAGLMKVASYELKGYFAKRRYRLFGLNCNHCTIEQRRECYSIKEPSQCPKGKAHQVLSLDKIVEGKDGNKPIVFLRLIAHKETIDLDARLDARNILKGLRKRLVQIGYKIYAGIPLEKEEEKYLKRWQKQKVCPVPFLARRDHLGERILELLREKPQGMFRAELPLRLHIPVGEVNLYLNRLIKEQRVVAVKRENTRGRPRSPLLLIAGAEIPQEKMVKTERDECIRQAYFMGGWSIKRIKRELHHNTRIIRTAIQNGRAAGIV